MNPVLHTYDTRLGLSIHSIPVSVEIKDPKVGVILFHGGGWTGGSPAQFYKLGGALAEMGHPVLLPEYRLIQKEVSTPVESVMDSQSALRWIFGKADTFRIDPHNIVVGGSSAGGHLALCNAVLPPEKLGTSASQCVRPSQLLLFNPVVDTSVESGYGGDRFPGDPLDYSPAHYNSLPSPTLIFHGDKDDLIPLKAVQSYCAGRDKAKLSIVPGAAHGFIYGMGDENSAYSEMMGEIKCFFGH